MDRQTDDSLTGVLCHQGVSLSPDILLSLQESGNTQLFAYMLILCCSTRLGQGVEDNGMSLDATPQSISQQPRLVPCARNSTCTLTLLTCIFEKQHLACPPFFLGVGRGEQLQKLLCEKAVHDSQTPKPRDVRDISSS